MKNTNGNASRPRYGCAADSRRGGALLSVLILITTLTVLLGTLYAGSWQRMRIMRSESHYAQATAIAEAGVHLTFAALNGDPSLASANNPILAANFGGGSYSVSLSEPMSGVYLISSQGTFGSQSVPAAATVSFSAPENTETNATPGSPIGPFGPAMLVAGGNLIFSGGINAGMGSYGAHANGNLTLSGGPSISGGYLSTSGSLSMNGNPTLNLGSGQLHANGSLELRGTIQASAISSSQSIQGNWGTTTSATNIAPSVTWPNHFNPMPTVVTQSVANVATLPMPDLDVNAFLSFAQANDRHYTGNQNINRSWITKDIKDRTGVNVHNNETTLIPEGGVLFVDGNVQIASDITLQGMVIASGNVTLAGAASINNPTDYPAIVSVNGNITVVGGSSMPNPNGWIYAMNGNVSAAGGASGFGIVAAQNITITGGYSVGTFEGGPFLSPGQTPPSGGGGNDDAGDLQLLSWTR